jgi:tryptophan 2,3-dioxygenase
MELVATKLNELGLSGIKTRDQFKEVVQSFGKVNGITKETLFALLDLAPAFAKVTDAIDSTTRAAIESADRQLQLARQAASADKDPRVKNGRTRLTDDEKKAKKQAGVDKELAGVEAAFKIIEAQAEIRFKKINEAITQADSFINDQIRAAEAGFSFINSLKESVADISTTSRTASKAQLDAAIQLVRITGDIKKVDTPELRNAIELLKEERTDLFSNRKDFSKDQADTARKINELAALGQSKTDETIKTLQDQLSTLKAILGAQELQTRVSLELARSQSLGVGANVGASKEESVVLSQSAGFVQALGKARLAILDAFGGSNGVGTNNLDPVTLGNFGASARQKDNIIKQALSALLEGGPNLDKTLAKLRDKFDSIGGNNPFLRGEFFRFPEVDKRTGLNAFPQFNFQSLLDELKLLRQETAANKTASQQMAALLNSVTRGGSAMVTA